MSHCQTVGRFPVMWDLSCHARSISGLPLSTHRASQRGTHSGIASVVAVLSSSISRGRAGMKQQTPSRRHANSSSRQTRRTSRSCSERRKTGSRRCASRPWRIGAPSSSSLPRDSPPPTRSTSHWPLASTSCWTAPGCCGRCSPGRPVDRVALFATPTRDTPCIPPPLDDVVGGRKNNAAVSWEIAEGAPMPVPLRKQALAMLGQQGTVQDRGLHSPRNETVRGGKVTPFLTRRVGRNTPGAIQSHVKTGTWPGLLQRFCCSGLLLRGDLGS